MPRKACRTIDEAAFSATVQTLLDPRFFRTLDRLISTALQQANTEHVRSAIEQMVQEMQSQARAKWGHETIEIVTLRQHLTRTAHKPDGYNPHQKPAQPDPIEYLQETKQLTPSEYSAATVIRNVWRAFGRYLMISGKGYDRSGSKGASALQPIDVMGQEIWEQHRDLYTPWYQIAKYCHTNRLGTGWVFNTELVFLIVVECRQPSELDRGFGLAPGAALSALRLELGRFFDPHRVLGEGKAGEATHNRDVRVVGG